MVGGGFEKSRLEKPYHLTTLTPYFQPSRTSFRKQFFRLPCNPLEAVRNHGFQDSGQTPLGSRDNYCNYEKNAVTLHSEIRDGHRFRPKSSGQKRQALFPSCESYGQICTRKSETGTVSVRRAPDKNDKPYFLRASPTDKFALINQKHPMLTLSMMRSDEDSLRTL